MPFQPGNTLAAKDRRWTAAINRALEKRSRKEGIDALDELAEKFLDMVEAAEDIQAFRELGNRLEGQPTVRAEVTGADGGPVYIKTGIDR